jgi:hypothetical protein
LRGRYFLSAIAEEFFNFDEVRDVRHRVFISRLLRAKWQRRLVFGLEL